MTRPLYYDDSMARDFTARILSCTPREDGRFEVVPDGTLFFPGGGGQPEDRGSLGGLDVEALEERGDEIVHILPAPLEPGQSVEGRIDWARRRTFMQNHTGEHILSGTAHRLFGVNNVGFHMDEDRVTLDYDRELSREELERLEEEANEAVFRDLVIEAFFPSPSELEALTYRSKKALEGSVRIVRIGDVDCCACCAPHMARTGQAGPIRITGSMRHRGGIRLTMQSGARALEEIRRQSQALTEAARLLSVPPTETPAALRRVMENAEQLKQELAAAHRELAALQLESMAPTEGSRCLFAAAGSDMTALRELVNRGAKRCGGVCGVFAGDDEEGYRYILGSQSVDLRAAAKEINAALSGRGGGQSSMIQGSCAASREEIEGFFRRFP